MTADPAPEPPWASIERVRVLNQMAAAERVRVITLTATAGFGKSTVLAQWSERWRKERAGEVVWLDVPQGADSRELAERLAGALTVTGVDSGGEPLPPAYDEPTWHGATMPALRALLDAHRGPLLVVIDDAMHLTDPLAPDLLETVLAGLPPDSQLAIGTRDVTPYPARRLRASGGTLELGGADLAMDAEEAGALLAEIGVEVGERQLEAVLERTEGWPVGLYLLGRALLTESDLLEVEGSPGLTPGWIADYLRDELFETLPEDAREFLIKVSVVGDLCGPVCDAVVGRPGSLELLRGLSAHNHLIKRSDRVDECYRLHHLFSDFLRSELYARSIPEYEETHRRAWEWYAGQGEDDLAVMHGKEMGDDEALAHFVWERTWRLLTSGRMPVARRWLTGIDERRVAGQLGLVLSTFYVSVHEGSMETTLQMAALVRGHLADGSLGDTDLAHCLVTEALLGEGGLPTIVRQTSEALQALEDTADPWLTLALYLRGVASLYLGDMSAAVADLEECVERCVPFGVKDMHAHCLAALAATRLTSGDVDGAVSQIEQARSIVFANSLENIPAMAPIFSVAASVMLVSGRHDDAANDAVRALRLTSLMATIAPWHAVGGRLALANVFWHLGDRQRAAVLIHEARNRYGPAAHSPVFDVMLKEAEAMVADLEISRTGPSLLTTAELKVLQYLPSHLSFPEIGQKLYLSRHTVKSQALSAYRKLGVSSRSQAVDRAHELGLLASR